MALSRVAKKSVLPEDVLQDWIEMAFDDFLELDGFFAGWDFDVHGVGHVVVENGGRGVDMNHTDSAADFGSRRKNNLHFFCFLKRTGFFILFFNEVKN